MLICRPLLALIVFLFENSVLLKTSVETKKMLPDKVMKKITSSNSDARHNLCVTSNVCCSELCNCDSADVSFHNYNLFLFCNVTLIWKNLGWERDTDYSVGVKSILQKNHTYYTTVIRDHLLFGWMHKGVLGNAQRSSGKISCWCHRIKHPIKSLSVSAGLHICRDITRSMTWHTICLPIKSAEWQARLYVSIVSYVIQLTLLMDLSSCLHQECNKHTYSGQTSVIYFD